MPDLRDNIQSSLQSFQSAKLRDASIGLLNTLGYQSEKTMQIPESSPEAFLEIVAENNPDIVFDRKKAIIDDWGSADILFQITDDELSAQQRLFENNDVNPGLLRSYLFFAVELTGSDYARGKLTAIARQINRAFPMPVMVFLKHQHKDKGTVLSIAVINRRLNKRQSDKDVLGKVTIIRDISLENPHRGHLDILDSFALENLKHPQGQQITDFDSLHEAWEEVFNVELLNKRFYRELADWYFWALPQVEFPADLIKDDEQRRATGLIRLLTRLIFCWFLKEKHLIPDNLFNQQGIESILVNLDEDKSTYHQAILQNLFFATLNQKMNTNKKKPNRYFAKDEGFLKNRTTYGIDNLYRYEKMFIDPEAALLLFEQIPFLNGGLFECLDRTETKTDKKQYLDGFSRNPKKQPSVPNELFFGEEREVDLSNAFGDKKRKKEKVKGLIHILNRYKFTIVENTPIDQEIALDPELLGKVFENLLASYNDETKKTARKQTGSFYTPRPIVDYMVDITLKAHLAQALVEGGGNERERCPVWSRYSLYLYRKRTSFYGSRS